MSDEVGYRFLITPYPTDDESDAIVTAMMLHLNKAANSETKHRDRTSRWAMAGRLRSHALRNPQSGILQERINAS